MPIHTTHSLSDQNDGHNDNTSCSKSDPDPQQNEIHHGHGDALASSGANPRHSPNNVKSFLNVLDQYDLTRWSPLEDEKEDILLEELRELDDVQLLEPGKYKTRSKMDCMIETSLTFLMLR